MNDEKELGARKLLDLKGSGLQPSVTSENALVFNMCSEFGYPVPTVGHDAIFCYVILSIEKVNVDSYGRFGALACGNTRG